MDNKFGYQLYGNRWPAMASRYGSETLGANAFSTLVRKTKNATHDILNAGAAIPITSPLVSTFRSLENMLGFGNKVSTETDSAIDAAAKAIKANKIKTAIILTAAAGGVGYLIYKSGKKSKRARR